MAQSTPVEMELEMALARDIEKVSANLCIAPPLLIEVQSADERTRIAVRPDDNIHDSVAKGLQCHPWQLEFVLFGEYPLDNTLTFLEADIDDGARLSVRVISLVIFARVDALPDLIRGRGGSVSVFVMTNGTTLVCFSQKFTVAEALVELRKMDGVSNFTRDGPPTETSVRFEDGDVEALPIEFWEALRCLVDLRELSLDQCRRLEALPEGARPQLHVTQPAL